MDVASLGPRDKPEDDELMDRPGARGLRHRSVDGQNVRPTLTRNVRPCAGAARLPKLWA